MHAESLESTKKLELLEARLSRVGSRELLLNKKFEICFFKFSTPKAVMLIHPLR